jgi:hypothetical protein
VDSTQEHLRTYSAVLNRSNASQSSIVYKDVDSGVQWSQQQIGCLELIMKSQARGALSCAGNLSLPEETESTLLGSNLTRDIRAGRCANGAAGAWLAFAAQGPLSPHRRNTIGHPSHASENPRLQPLTGRRGGRVNSCHPAGVTDHSPRVARFVRTLGIRCPRTLEPRRGYLNGQRASSVTPLGSG